MGFDFSNLAAADEPVWFVLTHPTTGADLERNGKPVRLAILGPDTAKMVAFEARIADRRLQQAGRTGKLTLTAAEIEAEGIERAAASIAGWENFALGGAEIVHSETEAKGLIGKFRWLRDFWEEKYRQRGNFLGTAASTPKK